MLNTATWPCPFSRLPITPAAASPPWMLSELIALTRPEVLDRAVSTVTTLTPAFMQVWIAGRSATGSVGAISRILGCLAHTAFTTGVWAAGVKSGDPWYRKLYPSLAASAFAPLSSAS